MYQPKYTITNKMLKHIGIIEASKQIVDHAPLLPYYEKKFRDDALTRAVHHGTHIEGNELNFSQAERVMQGESVVARERDIQEVINYRKAMELISELHTGKEKEQVDEELLFRLHAITVHRVLDPEKCGVFRKNQVVVRNSHSGEVTFRPPAVDVVPEQIADFIAFINTPRFLCG